MQRRPLGSTGLTVAEVGYGARGIGGRAGSGPTMTIPSVRSRVRSSSGWTSLIPLSVTVPGTASDSSVVGYVPCAFSRHRDEDSSEEWHLARPSGISPDEAFPADWIVECTEKSLRNLGLEKVDLQQFHVGSDDWLDRGDWLEAVERLKRDGKIRLFGVSVNDHAPESVLRLVASGHVDTVQVIYNIFDQSPSDDLFPGCQGCGIRSHRPRPVR